MKRSDEYDLVNGPEILELIDEVRRSFPTVRVRLETHSVSIGPGLWEKQKFWELVVLESVLPDGPSICPGFNTAGDDEYDGGLLIAFGKWFENRGWYLECWNDFIYHPTPLPTDAELEEYKAAWRGPFPANSSAVAVADNGLPF